MENTLKLLRSMSLIVENTSEQITARDAEDRGKHLQLLREMFLVVGNALKLLRAMLLIVENTLKLLCAMSLIVENTLKITVRNFADSGKHFEQIAAHNVVDSGKHLQLLREMFLIVEGEC